MAFASVYGFVRGFSVLVIFKSAALKEGSFDAILSFSGK
jgi:hypothetical protein